MSNDTESLAGNFIISGIIAMLLGGLLIAIQLDSLDPNGMLLALGWFATSLGWAAVLAGMIGVAVRGRPPEQPQSKTAKQRQLERLKELKTQLDIGYLTPTQYEEARREILDQ